MIQQPKGSGFTNINRILQANQQNKLGQAIGSGVQQGANQFKSGLGDAQNQFGANIADINNKKQQDVTSVGATTQKLSAGGSAIGQQEQDSATRLIAQNYGQDKLAGGLNNINNLAGQAQQTEGLARQTGSSEGRQNLLQRFVGKGQYTGGQQRLDNLILGQTGQSELASARRAGVGLGSDLNQAQQGARGQVGALNQDLMASKQQAIAGIGQGINQLGQTATEAAMAATAQRQTQLTAAQALVAKIKQAQGSGGANSLFLTDGGLGGIQNQGSTGGSGKLDGVGTVGAPSGAPPKAFANNNMLTPEQLQMLGIDLDNNSYYAGDLNLDNLANSISTTKDANVNAIQTMTPEQKASYLALQRLGGEETSRYNPLNVNDNTEVGNQGEYNLVNKDAINKNLSDSNRSVQADQSEFDRILTNNAELTSLNGNSVEAFKRGGLKGMYDAELTRMGLAPGNDEQASRDALGQALGRGYGQSGIPTQGTRLGGDYGAKTLDQSFSEIDKLVTDPIKRDQLKANIAYNALLLNQNGQHADVAAGAQDNWRTGNYLGRANEIAKGGQRFVRIGNLMKGVN